MTLPVLESNAVTDQPSTSTSVVCTAPSGIADDDILIIICALDGDAGNPTSSGFTQFGGVSEGNVELYYLWKRASSESGDYTVNWTGTQQGRFMMLRISGCITGENPLDITGTANTNAATSTNTAQSVSSTETDTLAIAAVAVDRDRVDAADGLSTANGFTEVGVSGSSGGANGAGLIVAEKDLPSIGASLSPIFGTWSSDQNVSRMFNLKPAAAAAFNNNQGYVIG